MEKQTEATNATPVSLETIIKDTNFSANIQYFETIVKEESISPQRVVIFARNIYIIDKNGTTRQTDGSVEYKIYMKNGQINFDKPLKFKP